MKKSYIRYAMTDLYEIRMSLIVAQESLYEMKYSFGQLINFYTDFTAVFILRVNIRFLVGYIRYWMLQSNATLYRGLTCLKTSKTLFYMKIMVCKIPPGGGGAKPFLASGLLSSIFAIFTTLIMIVTVFKEGIRA